MLFWIKFEDDDERVFTVQAKDRGAAAQLARLHKQGKITSIKPLPHPSQPHLGPVEDASGSALPDLCWRPHLCAGNTSCPTTPSCTS